MWRECKEVGDEIWLHNEAWYNLKKEGEERSTKENVNYILYRTFFSIFGKVKLIRKSQFSGRNLGRTGRLLWTRLYYVLWSKATSKVLLGHIAISI